MLWTSVLLAVMSADKARVGIAHTHLDSLLNVHKKWLCVAKLADDFLSPSDFASVALNLPFSSLFEEEGLRLQ